jgi:hypothetical protein
LLKHVREGQSEFWVFRHPAIRDAYATWSVLGKAFAPAEQTSSPSAEKSGTAKVTGKIERDPEDHLDELKIVPTPRMRSAP